MVGCLCSGGGAATGAIKKKGPGSLPKQTTACHDEAKKKKMSINPKLKKYLSKFDKK